MTKIAMASPSSSFMALRPLAHGQRVRSLLRTRSQCSDDEGKSSVSPVDGNMGVLKERIEMVRVRQRLRKGLRRSNDGWHCLSEYDHPNYKLMKRDAKSMAESFEVVELVLGTFGLTIVSCTICLCLLSFIAHLLG